MFIIAHDSHVLHYSILITKERDKTIECNLIIKMHTRAHHTLHAKYETNEQQCTIGNRLVEIRDFPGVWL